MSIPATTRIVLDDRYVDEAMRTGGDIADCLFAWMTDQDVMVIYNDWQAAYFKAVRAGLQEEAIPGMEGATQPERAKARQKHMRDIYRAQVYALTEEGQVDAAASVGESREGIPEPESAPERFDMSTPTGVTSVTAIVPIKLPDEQLEDIPGAEQVWDKLCRFQYRSLERILGKVHRTRSPIESAP